MPAASKSEFEQDVKTKPLVKCQVCNAQVRQDRLDKHMRKVHSGQSQLPITNQESLTQSSPPILGKTSLVKCQICGIFVRQNRLDKHIKQTHPINYKNIRRKSLTTGGREKRLPKQAAPEISISKVILESKRGTRVKGEGRQCNECGLSEEVLWRYSQSNFGLVYPIFR